MSDGDSDATVFVLHCWVPIVPAGQGWRIIRERTRGFATSHWHLLSRVLHQLVPLLASTYAVEVKIRSDGHLCQPDLWSLEVELFARRSEGGIQVPIVLEWDCGARKKVRQNPTKKDNIRGKELGLVDVL
jgi:hypothetical protein